MTGAQVMETLLPRQSSHHPREDPSHEWVFPLPSQCPDALLSLCCLTSLPLSPSRASQARVSLLFPHRLFNYHLQATLNCHQALSHLMSQVCCELWDDNLTCMCPMCSLHAPAWSHHVLQNCITYPILILK